MSQIILFFSVEKFSHSDGILDPGVVQLVNQLVRMNLRDQVVPRQDGGGVEGSGVEMVEAGESGVG